MQVSHLPHSIPRKVLHSRETLHHCRGGHSRIGNRLKEIKPKLFITSIRGTLGPSFWMRSADPSALLSGSLTYRLHLGWVGSNPESLQGLMPLSFSEPCSPQRAHQLPLPWSWNQDPASWTAWPKKKKKSEVDHCHYSGNILQYKNVSNQHVIQLKFTMLFVKYVLPRWH